MRTRLFRRSRPWPPLNEPPKAHLLVGSPIRIESYCSLSGAHISIGDEGHITVAATAILVECIITVPHYPYEDFITVEDDGIFRYNFIDERT